MRRAAIFAAVIGGLGAGCSPGLVHPMRVSDGVMGEVGLSFGAADGRQMYCYDGCIPSASMVPGPWPHGFVGYGAVVEDHVGLMVGLGWPGRVDDQWDLSPRALGMVTLQDRWGSIGLATDVSIGGIAGTALWEVRPMADDEWGIAIGVFNRWYAPWVETEPDRLEPDAIPEHREADAPLLLGYEFGGMRPGVDIGPRVTVGPIFVQWTASMELDGHLRAYPIPLEGRSFSQIRHVVTLGLSIDRLMRMRHAARDAAIPAIRRSDGSRSRGSD